MCDLQAQGTPGNEAVDPSVRSVVYNQAVLVGGGEAWNTMHDMYRQVQAPRSALLYILIESKPKLMGGG